MNALLPDVLKAMWDSRRQTGMTPEAFELEQDRLLEAYTRRWTQALLLEPHSDLQLSVLTELSLYSGCHDLHELRRRCTRAAAAVADDWKRLSPADERNIEKFYNESENYIYDLMWWHTLSEDNSPLAYVTALHYAQQHEHRSHLDFGAGVGSGSILFLRNGMQSTLADISSTLLEFSKWRIQTRGLKARFVDLKVRGLPDETFDIVTAMDVFEHLVDPVKTATELWRTLKPGGVLFGRFGAEPEDDEHPQHIFHDAAPTMDGIRALGFVEVWRDEWLWGNQVFQKPRKRPARRAVSPSAREPE
jgi:SAM-dependent methyltransferase